MTEKNQQVKSEKNLQNGIIEIKHPFKPFVYSIIYSEYTRPKDKKLVAHTAIIFRNEETGFQTVAKESRVIGGVDIKSLYDENQNEIGFIVQSRQPDSKGRYFKVWETFWHKAN